MTRPTNDQIAALLRELAITSDHHAAHLQGQRYLNWAQQARDSSARARAAAKEIEGRKVEYRFNVFVDDNWSAGGSASTQEEAEREARHYLSLYEQEGDCIVVIECCIELARFGIADRARAMAERLEGVE